jgi:hypothetical protein
MRTGLNFSAFARNATAGTIRPNREGPVMKRKIRLFLSFAAVLAATGGFCHPPSEIQLVFDAASRTLHVTVMHDTRKPDEHFIETVQVRINDKEAVKQSFVKQTDGLKRAASYLLEDVKAGDLVSVTGICSVFGKKTETIKL